MLTIIKDNYKIVVRKIKKNFFELQRVTSSNTISTYAKLKELESKIDFLSQPITNLRKVYNF